MVKESEEPWSIELACAVPVIAGQIFQVPFILVRPDGLTASVPASFT